MSKYDFGNDLIGILAPICGYFLKSNGISPEYPFVPVPTIVEMIQCELIFLIRDPKYSEM